MIGFSLNSPADLMWALPPTSAYNIRNWWSMKSLTCQHILPSSCLQSIICGKSTFQNVKCLYQSSTSCSMPSKELYSVKGWGYVGEEAVVLWSIPKVAPTVKSQIFVCSGPESPSWGGKYEKGEIFHHFSDGWGYSVYKVKNRLYVSVQLSFITFI